MTTTAPLLDRALPEWGVSDELNTLMAKVRKIPGLYYLPYERFNARLTELIKAEKPLRDRVTFESFLSTDQLNSVLSGEAFSIRRSRFRSCIFPSGRVIHLQGRSNAGRAGRYDSSGYSLDAMCSANGSYLDLFDEWQYDRLATTEKIGRLEYLSGKTLTSEQMLAHVCERCVAIAHRAALEKR